MCAAMSKKGTTTTPFDMLVLNRASRYHLCIEALRRQARTADKALTDKAHELTAFYHEALDKHRKHVVEHLEDVPEVRNWKWDQN